MGRIVTTELPNLVPPRHIDDCYAIHFLHWELCDLRLSSHQNFPLWARCTSTSSARSPRYFRLQADIASGVLRKVRVDTMLTGTRFHFCSRLHFVIHEKNWKYLDPYAQGFPVALKDYFHRPNFLSNPAASRASLAMDRFVLSRVLHFYFLFSVSVGLCCGISIAPHSYFHFFGVLDVLCICWR